MATHLLSDPLRAETARGPDRDRSPVAARRTAGGIGIMATHLLSDSLRAGTARGPDRNRSPLAAPRTTGGVGSMATRQTIHCAPG